MNIKLKSIIIFSLFFLAQQIAFSQDLDKTVTLVATGQGKTYDEAKINALRSAIEQAFGTFISSNTTILNDNLVKDEIISVTNGNIKSYQKISEIKIDDQNVTSTLSVVVTLNKLTDYVKSKGFFVDFNGDLFASNIIIKNFNKENEIKVIGENFKIASKLITKIFDYEIKVVPPKMLDNKLWGIGLNIQVFSNDNSKVFFDWFQNIIKSISLSKSEILEYKNLNMELFKINFVYGNNVIWEGGEYYFRDKKSIDYFSILFEKMILTMNNYDIINSSDIKYGDLLYEDPKIKSMKSEFMGSSNNWWQAGIGRLRTFSNMPKTMNKYNDMYTFCIFKKGVNVITFENIDVLNIDEIKKVTEYKINPRK
jgi:hypothetical protein